MKSLALVLGRHSVFVFKVIFIFVMSYTLASGSIFAIVQITTYKVKLSIDVKVMKIISRDLKIKLYTGQIAIIGCKNCEKLAFFTCRAEM